MVGPHRLRPGEERAEDERVGEAERGSVFTRFNLYLVNCLYAALRRIRGVPYGVSVRPRVSRGVSGVIQNGSLTLERFGCVGARRSASGCVGVKRA